MMTKRVTSLTDEFNSIERRIDNCKDGEQTFVQISRGGESFDDNNCTTFIEMLCTNNQR